MISELFLLEHLTHMRKAIINQKKFHTIYLTRLPLKPSKTNPPKAVSTTPLQSRKKKNSSSREKRLFDRKESERG